MMMTKEKLGLALLAILFGGCGLVPPPPPASCVQACNHLSTLRTEGLPADLPPDGCGTSVDLCERLCAPVEPTNAAYPACVASASSCAAANSCQ